MNTRTLALVSLLAPGGFFTTPLQAAFITDYGAVKLITHEQEGEGPANPPVVTGHDFYAFAVQTEPDAVLFGSVATGIFPTFLGPDAADPTLLQSEDSFTTQAQLDSTYPNGSFAFGFLSGEGDSLAASLELTGDGYPPAPALKNFTAAQSIEAAQAFTLQWEPPAELTASDYVIVTVEADGEPVVSSPRPWEPGALGGDTASFTIPAGVLPAEAELRGLITFVKISEVNTGDIPDATGVAGYGAETEFPLVLSGSGGGGGDDTTPPFLTITSPLSGALGVAPNATVRFTFSEPMQLQQFVTWSGVPNPGAFLYSWSPNGTALTCTYPEGFPPGALVNWALNPASFVDLAGNALFAQPPAQVNGSFTVAGGADGCGALEEQADTFFLARSGRYRQTSTAAPALDTAGEEGSPLGFFATFNPASLAADAAEFAPPGGPTTALNNLFGRFFFQQGFATEAALNAAYPAGSYSTRLTVAGTPSLQNVTLGEAPTLPRCANYAAAQAVSPAADFTLTWDAFAGAGGNDRLEIILEDEQGATVFHLPDECAAPPRPLAASATSTVIPANTLQAGRTYAAELTFYRVSDLKENTSPAYTVIGGYARTTRFTVKTTGGGGQAPVITGYRVAADQRFEVNVTAGAGRELTLLATTDYQTWTPVGTVTVPASGQALVRDSRMVAAGLQAYRVSSN